MSYYFKKKNIYITIECFKNKEKAEESLCPYSDSCDLPMISIVKYNIIFHLACFRRKMYPPASDNNRIFSIF